MDHAITYSYSFNFSFLVKLLQNFPGFQIFTRLWPVNKVKIQVIQFHSFQSLFKSFTRGFNSLVFYPQLRRNKDLFSRNTAFSNCFPYSLFISVKSCGIYQSVTSFKSRCNCIIYLFSVIGFIYPKS